MRWLVSGALAALAACMQPAPVGAPAPKAALSSPAARVAASTVKADTEADSGASVSQVVGLARGDAKIYSTAGGDPAINGLYTYVAVIESPADGWKTFKIGDFNSWEVVEQSNDRVVLKISHSAVEDATGDIVTAEQKIAVTVPAYSATEVSVTPVE